MRERHKYATRSWTALVLVCTIGGRATAALATFAPSTALVVSYKHGRTFSVVDPNAGTALIELVASRIPRDIAASSTRLLVAERDQVERFAFDGTHEASSRLNGVTHIAAGSDGLDIYVTESRPAGIAALRWGASNAITWNAKTPSRVRAVALDPTGRILFVAYGQHPGTVAMFDTTTGVALRTTSIACAPTALVASHDGRRVYALCRDDRSVTTVSVADGSHGAPLRLGKRPRAIAVAADDSRLYVLDPGSRSLLVVDANRFALQRSVALPGRPFDLAVTGDGSRIGVTSPSSKALFILDAATLQSLQTVRLPRSPRRIVAVRPPATPVATVTASETPSGVAIESFTSTPLPTSIDTPTPTVTLAAIPTATPATVRAITGAVFDDDTAQPLPDVLVRFNGSQSSTDVSGHYLLLANDRDGTRVELSKDGYTRAVRRLDASGAASQQLRDARLTLLSAPELIGPDGGVIGVTYRAPGAAQAVIQLEIPAGNWLDATNVQLTGLSPQGLIAPLPLGWSVLLGIDIQPTLPAGATVRIPLTMLTKAVSRPVSIALWDDAAAQWHGGPTPTLVDDALEVLVPPAAAVSSTQLAVLVADLAPHAPPAAVDGAPLLGVLPLGSGADAAVVLAQPATVLAGAPTRAQVVTQLISVGRSHCSGTSVEVQVQETFDLHGGRQIRGAPSRQELAAYQISAGASDGADAGAILGAYFSLMPSRSVPLGELAQGRVTIDVRSPVGAETPTIIGPSGGTVIGDGLRLTVPPGAARHPTGLALHSVAPTMLPNDAAGRPDLLAAFELALFGASMDDTAAYRLDFDALPPPGQRMVIGRLAHEEVGNPLVIVGLGHVEAGGVVLETCPPGAAACLGGLGASGIYVIFTLPAEVALATGTVRDAAGVRANVAVERYCAAPPAACPLPPLQSLTDAAGVYVLPVQGDAASQISAHDPVRDLSGSVTVAPTGGAVVVADLMLVPTAPAVVQIDPPRHASRVPLDTAITVAFSEAIAPDSLHVPGALTVVQAGGAAGTEVSGRLSLDADGRRARFTPRAPLATDARYTLRLTGAVTDLSGTPLVPFDSDFTTAPLFRADALPPGTLRVSLPDDQDRVFVCSGAQLAAPGTTVIVTDAVSGLSVTVTATDIDGRADSDTCDALFAGRCNAAQPGAFCAVLAAAYGDPMRVTVTDTLGNEVTLDAGLMHDEVTGTTAVGPEGGTVFAAADAGYRLVVPAGAFDMVTLVTVTPATKDELPSTADATMEFVGGAHLDFGGRIPLKQVDLSVPAPSDATGADQYLATQVVNFRGVDELTAIDTAFWDQADGLVTTDPGVFPGILLQGLFGMVRPRDCVATVKGFVSLGEHFIDGVIPGQLALPFAVAHPGVTQWTVPVPCNRPIDVSLLTPAGNTIDFLSLSQVPRKGEVIITEQILTDDHTPPTVLGARTSVPDHATDVGHDAEISLSFSEPVLTASLTPDNVQLWCRRPGGEEVALRGEWTQSADGRRIFFAPFDGRDGAWQPLHGLPLGTACRVRVAGVRDRNGQPMTATFSTEFATFTPTVHRDTYATQVDAMAVDSIGWHQSTGSGSPLLQQYVAFAEGDRYKVDFDGGIRIQDVTEQATRQSARVLPTAGVDYALRFVPPEAIALANSRQLHGPYLMSVDGPGRRDSRQRFGVWRLFDLGPGLDHVEQVLVRHINQSADSFDLLGSLDPSTDPATYEFLRSIPSDLGIPEAVADLGIGFAYIANAPVIGLEMLHLSDIDPRTHEDGVHVILPGTFHAVATLGPWVIGARPDGLVVTDAALRPRSAVPPDYALDNVRSVLALPRWPIDRDRNGKIGDDEVFDLVVATCTVAARPSLCISAFDTGSGRFAPERLNGIIQLPGDSLPARAFADAERRLLYVANGTVGLSVVDFQDPEGRLDDSPADGVDDRVLISVPLPAGTRLAAARDVAAEVDKRGRVIAFVAAHEDGWYEVDLGPARMDVHLEAVPTGATVGTARVRTDEVRYFNEKASTFYNLVVQLPGHLADLYPEHVRVRVSALDVNGVPVTAPDGDFAPASRSVVLDRVRQTNRYELAPDALLVSNLPLAELQQLTGAACLSGTCSVVYGGLGGLLRLEAEVLPDTSSFPGRERTIPIEKVGVILIGIDGLRQEVLYPEGEEDVHEPGLSERLRLDVEDTPGFAEVMGGVRRSGTGRSDVNAHSLRLRGVSAIFPSITLASWASILSGKGPKDTGELGNEFFDRSLASKPGSGVPKKRNPPPGMITYSNGAFPGYDTYSPNEKHEWDFVPPNDPNPFTTPQNQLWTTASLFEQLSNPFNLPADRLESVKGYRDNFGPVVVAGAHYAKGADRWLTVDPSRAKFVLAAGPLTAIDCGFLGFHDNGPDCARVADRNFREHLLEYLDGHAAAWFDGRERFPGFLMLYQMGPDHVAHEKGLGADYTDYIRDVTGGETLAALAAKLRDLEQYYNKIFVMTADHGHTETGAAPGDDREDWTLNNWTKGGPLANPSNRNMDVGEFNILTDLLGRVFSPRKQFRLLAPENSVPSEADIAVAFDGPVAHVYVRSGAGETELTNITWGAPARQEDRDAIANGILAALGGSSVSFESSDDLHADAANVSANGKFLLRTLAEAVDFVLVRKEGGYVVRKPVPIATVTPLPPATSTEPPITTPPPSPSPTACSVPAQPRSAIQEFRLDDFFAHPPDTSRDTYVSAVSRIKELNQDYRSGDVIVVFRSRTDEGPGCRYVASSNIPSWHGSLNRSDSYVPLTVSYPGGNTQPLRGLVADACDADETGLPRCTSSLQVGRLIKRVLSSQIVQE